MDFGGNRIETELAKILKSKIRDEGPLTFRNFMATALYDEHYGFYTQGPNIGSPEGPFDTNAKFPAFGFAMAQAIQHAEKNTHCPLRILELGGGTGQLGKHILAFLQNPHEYLVLEPSSGMRAKQAQNKLQAIPHVKDLPSRPTFIFGNEVLDALPVHRVMGLAPGEIVELYVDLDEKGEFFEQPGPPSNPELSERLQDEGVQLGRGQVTEICLEYKPFLQNIRQVVEQGYLIFIDYGDWAVNVCSYRHRNGTLRSYYHQQQIHDPFFAIGQQDLTAEVDYSAVISVAKELELEVNGPIPQETWLRNLGIQAYANSGSHGTFFNKKEKQKRQEEIEILLNPAGLGSTFDVLIFRTSELAYGPGFQPHQ